MSFKCGHDGNYNYLLDPCVNPVEYFYTWLNFRLKLRLSCRCKTHALNIVTSSKASLREITREEAEVFEVMDV